MREILSITVVFLTSLASAQVVIGDINQTPSNGDRTSVLLEFSTAENRGLILPYVTSLPQNPVKGTFLVDATNADDVKVVYYDGTQWKEIGAPAPQTKANITNHLTSQNQ